MKSFSTDRAIAVLASLVFGAIFVYSIDVSCDFYQLVRGYDRCRPPSAPFSMAYLFFAVAPSFFLPLNDRLSSKLIWLAYYMHVFGAIYSSIYLYPSAYDALVYCMLIFISFSAIALLVGRVKLKRYLLKVDSGAFLLFWFITGVVALVYIHTRFEVSMTVASLSDVYGVRSDFSKDLAFYGNWLDGYVILIAAYAISPICIVTSLLVFRRWKVVSIAFFLLGLLISFSVYSVAAFKSAAFIFLLVIVSYLFFGRMKRMSSVSVLILTLSASLLFLHVVGGGDDFIVNWFRRVFIVPGMNANFYNMEYGLLNTRVVTDAPQEISALYYGTPGSANAGLYGSGMALGGLAGLIVTLAIFTGLVVVSDFFGGLLPARVTISMMLPGIYAASNSAITTTLVSYGVIVVLVYLYGLAGMLAPGRLRGRPS